MRRDAGVPTPLHAHAHSDAAWRGKAKGRSAMAKHHPDLIMCRKQPGIGMFEISDFCPDPLRLRSPLPLPSAAVGRLCEKCDGKCPVCDSYVRPCVLVRICDECNYGSYQVRPNDSFVPPNCRSFPSCLLMVVSTVFSLFIGPLRGLRRTRHLGCILLQRVHEPGKRCAFGHMISRRGVAGHSRLRTRCCPSL